MKYLKLTILMFIGFSSAAQDGFGVGAYVSTAFHLNTHRNKLTTLWSAEPGYGFSAGVPIRYGYADGRAFVTGLNYDYKAFDNWVFGVLQFSTRFHSLTVPLGIQFQLIDNWHLQVGGGMTYNFRSRTFQPGNSINISNSANPAQPFLSIGINSISNRNSKLFDLGFSINYHFLDMWRKSYPQYDIVSSKILTTELQMRFYF